jgi:hypothetical protein
VVSIRATVRWDQKEQATIDKDQITVKIPGNYDPVFVDLDAVELIHHAFKPDDRVIVRGIAKGAVIAVHEQLAWIKLDSGVTDVQTLQNLEHIADEDKSED